MNTKVLEEKRLTRAVLTALEMWSHPKYRKFVPNPKYKPGPLKKDWFRRFVRDWRVARTIKKGKLECVRRYLDTKARKRLLALSGGARDVDEAAKYIKRWSAKRSQKGNGPRSLVSKVGYFLKPDILVPEDNLARCGLKKLQELRGVPPSKIKSYCDYLHAFDNEFELAEKQIRDALTESWVAAVAKKLDCPVRLKSRPMQRKVLDNYLVTFGKQEEGR